MKREVRDQFILDAARSLHGRGVKPTARHILAELKGGRPQDYPQGMQADDLKAYRRAMADLGYSQNALTGRWS